MTSKRQREAEERVQGRLGNASDTDYDPSIAGPDVNDDPGRGANTGSASSAAKRDAERLFRKTPDASVDGAT